MSQHINYFAKTLRDSNSQKNIRPVRQNKTARPNPASGSSTANVRITKKRTLKAAKACANATASTHVTPTADVRTASADSVRATTNTTTSARSHASANNRLTTNTRTAAVCTPAVSHTSFATPARSSHTSTVRTTKTAITRAMPTIDVRTTNASAVRAAKYSAIRATNAFYTQTAKNSAVRAAQTTSIRAIPNTTTRVVHNSIESKISKSSGAEIGVDIRPLKKVKRSISLKEPGSNIATSEVSAPNLETKDDLYKTEASNRQTLSSIDVAKYSFDLTELESLQDKDKQYDQTPVNLKRKLEQTESTVNYQEATMSTPASPTPAYSIPTSPPQMFTSSYLIKRLFASDNLRDTTNDQVIIPAHSHQTEKATLPLTSQFASTRSTAKPESDCTNQENFTPRLQAHYKRALDLVQYLNNAPLKTTIEDILDKDIFSDILVPRNPKLCEREVGDFTENANFSWSMEPQLTQQLSIQEDFKDDLKNYFNRTNFFQEGD
ncbi:hypothetical protein G6F56_006118 [Rhizopus delemar]|uniref:Uncharacterized protein n=1 Tax=Rhizopus stolonifer TaxID=4846 RepID=A0A367J967_RHIST|nr:hypothetical protein G6F56_006118 [Rhizopus delemar]RCH86478.1 hypothetical protein CU098_001789 [Rhizopus stolonifer]